VKKSQSLNALSEDRPDVSVLVVSYNTRELLGRMFAALNAARGKLSLQIIVVDNASRDGSAEFVRSDFPEAELIENSENVGFGRANNQAIPRAKGRYILLLNTDAFVAPDALSKTIEYMDTNLHCGLLGVKLVGSDGSLQPSCRFFPTPWNVFLSATGLTRLARKTRLVDDMSWDHNSIRECDWVPGCFYLIRREVIERVGLFDPIYFLYYEEVDHCRRIRDAGWSIVYFPFTQVVHLGGESAKSVGTLTDYGQVSELQIESELLYFRKHFGFFGLARATLLSLLANALSCGKALLRFNTKGMRRSALHIKKLFAILLKTRFGAAATR
jgi:GT2 family glycosyltransferase